MRLTRKLAFAVGVGICLVLALRAAWQQERDTQAFRDDVARDHATYGRSIAAVMHHVAVADGVDRAIDVVAAVDRHEPHLTIRWVRFGARGGDPHAPLRPDLVPPRWGGARSTIVDGPDGVPYTLTYVPVDLTGPRDGAIELYESMADERVYARQALLRNTTTTGLVILVCLALIFGFGALFIARPVRKLVDRADRIGHGDLAGRLELTQNDELRDLALAMNAMSDRLAGARDRVAHETQARLEALEQLRHADRLRTVGELASGVAHELGTPLNVVRARASMIAAGEVPPARLPEIGTLIVEHVDRMARIIRQLLDFARRQPAKPASTELARPVERAVRMLEPLAERKGVALALEIDGASPVLALDAAHIEQAVANLVVNAIDATPAGGRVGVRVARDGAAALVEVSDTGHGIDDAALARIFEPFYTTKIEGQGTGLGLSVVDGIVREHGGRIDVRSKPGAGATFVVRLPRVVAERRA